MINAAENRRARPVVTFMLIAVFAMSHSGCPTTTPDPEPEPEPETSSAFFRVPRTFTSGDGPDAVAVASLNNDAFPDIVTANALDDTIGYWLSAADGTYDRAEPLATGGMEPRAVAAQDLDGDDLVDLASANTASDSLTVFYGLGAGLFSAATSVALPEGAAPRDVAVLDANGDGLLDLVSANSGLGSVSLVLALAEGGFDMPANLLTGEGTRSLLAADLNNDTFTDLVAANRDANSLSVFLNEDGGLFAEPVSLATGTAPRMVQGADLDRDGQMDLIVSNPGSASFGIHMGAGAGTFDAVVFTMLDANPTRFALADFTDDGNLDIVSVLFADAADTVSSGDLVLLAGDGRGRFAAEATYHVDAGVVDLAATDIDRDGMPDLAACNLAEDTMLIVSSPDAGVFDAERRFATGSRPRFIFSGDVDRDDNVDLITGNLESDDITVLLGDGGGGFDSIESYAAGGPARALALGLIDEDNNLDIAVTNLDQSRIAVLLGEGGGSFGAAAYYSVRAAGSTRSAEPRSIALADMDEDGNVDAVVGNANLDSVAILLGDGEGAFAEAVEYDAGNFPLDVHVADLNGDGDLDVVLINGVDLDGMGTQTSAVRVIPGNGDGTLAPEGTVAYVANSGPGSLVVADLDSDGDLDVATSHNALDSVQLFLNRGNGALGSGGTLVVGDGPNTVDVADLNNDGYPDVYTTDDGGTVTLRLRRRTFLYERAETLDVGSVPIAGLAVDLDGDGRLDLAVPNRDTDDLSVVLGRAD